MIDLPGLIYNQVEYENEERERKIRHYPSSACAITSDGFVGKCRRASYYSLMQFEPTNPIPGVNLFKMNIGNMLHDYVSDLMSKALEREFGSRYKSIWNEQTGEGEGEFVWDHKDLELPISGRLDKIFLLDDKKIGCEWKSTFGAGITSIKKNGPKIEALLQCLTYLEQDIVPIDALLLGNIARDSGYIYGFLVEQNNGIDIHSLHSDVTYHYDLKFDMIVEGLQTLERSYRGKEVPPKDYVAKVNENKLTRNSDWQCRYCSYRSLCWGVEE
jgi:hypothetical protein